MSSPYRKTAEDSRMPKNDGISFLSGLPSILFLTVVPSYWVYLYSFGVCYRQLLTLLRPTIAAILWDGNGDAAMWIWNRFPAISRDFGAQSTRHTRRTQCSTFDGLRFSVQQHCLYLIVQSFSSPWFRTRERVEAAAEAAGLKCQVNGVQILEFGQDLNSQDLKLMELNDDIVEELRLGRRYSVFERCCHNLSGLSSYMWL